MAADPAAQRAGGGSGPDRAGREVLPMSTGVAILPTQSAQITARPQRVAFRPERVFISAAGTSGGAADWVVNDIKIGNRSQFSQSGDVPGDMFATNAIDGFVSFETAQTAMDVVMVVTYIGLNESGVSVLRVDRRNGRDLSRGTAPKGRGGRGRGRRSIRRRSTKQALERGGTEQQTARARDPTRKESTQHVAPLSATAARSHGRLV